MTVSTDLPCDVVAASVQFNDGTTSIAATPALRLGEGLKDSIPCLFAIAVMRPSLTLYACHCTAFCTDTVLAEDISWEDKPRASWIVAIGLIRGYVLDGLEVEALSKCGAEDSLD